eukprot:6467569-Prorocentrum_lima.AAC.1
MSGARSLTALLWQSWGARPFSKEEERYQGGFQELAMSSVPVFCPPLHQLITFSSAGCSEHGRGSQ